MGWFWPPLPREVSTTNPGKSAASLPRPYVTHAPMLGRPAICEPVFMNMWAGSWLIASVVIERIRQMSSITEPIWGNSEQISIWFLPNACKRVLWSEALEFLSLELGELLPLGQALGHRLAVHLGELRLGVEGFQVGWPARHREPDHALGLLRQRQRAQTFPVSVPHRAAPDARATPAPASPDPARVCPGRRGGSGTRLPTSSRRLMGARIASREDSFDDFCPLHAGELGFEPLELEAERVVLDAELMQHRGVEIVDRADVLDGGVAEVIG